MDNVYQSLKGKLPKLQKDISLAEFTSFKIGGPAKYFFVAKNNKEIVKAVKAARQEGIPFFILGNGSNILVSDNGYDGLVIKMENASIVYDKTAVTAESGVKLQKLINDTITKGLGGLEFLAGIPGTVGGGVAGNVGTPDDWIEKNLVSVEILNSENEIETVPKSRCDFSYRFSRFKYDEQVVILGATWDLYKEPSISLRKKITEFMKKRGHQPAGQPCAGSIFKNPPGKKSWQLIDAVGLRGKQIGGAKVSDEHANFIINTGNAKAEDVVILISYIKQQVRDTLGYQLQEEIKYIGF